jgi:hypothetical protein
LLFSQGLFGKKLNWGNLLCHSVIIRNLREDGTEKANLQLDDLYYIIAVDDGWIYYQSSPARLFEGDVNSWYEVQGSIYMVRTDGSEKKEIVFDNIS